MNSAIAALIAGCLTLGLAACDRSGGDSDEARRYLVDLMQRRQEARHVVALDDWTDVLPHVEHTPAPGRVEAEPLSSLVVLGTVERAEPGRAFVWEDTVREVRTEVPFDAPRAHAKTFHLMVRVDEVIAGEGAEAGGTVTVGVAVQGGADTAKVVEAFGSMGRVLLPLDPGSPVFDYDDDVWAVPRDGGLMATVDGSGALALPFIPAADAADLLEPSATVDDVRAAVR